MNPIDPSVGFAAQILHHPERAADQINIQSVFVQAGGDPSLRTVPDWSVAKGVILSMHFNDGVSHQCDGSAVMVAPGIAFCAAHVVEPHIDAILTLQMRTLCIGIADHGAELWTIKHITLIQGCDVAVLGLRGASALQPHPVLHQANMTTRTPAVGERLTVMGFRNGDRATMVEGRAVHWGGALWQVAGSVTEHYLQGRDSVMLPGPCLMLDCDSLGGMSGGPVFDAHGYLVGILAAGMESPEGGGPSYVSLLWNCLGARIKADWPPGLHPEDCSLLELEGMCCAIERKEMLELMLVDGRMHTAYTLWS